MTKKQIALTAALLALVGSASAQSNVTLYGILDVYYANLAVDGKATLNKLDSGAVNQSRWGMKGSEDLGGGLKANFELAAGFSMDTGAADNGTSANTLPAVSAAFSRQSWVGFSSDSLGAVRLGRTYTPFDDQNGAADGLFDSKLSAQRQIFRTADLYGSQGYTSNFNNMVYYQAPRFAGFSAAVAFGLGEDASTTLGGASHGTSMNVTYANGPLAAGVAYQTQVVAVGGAQSKDFTRVNAAYDFGVAKLKGSFGKAANLPNAPATSTTVAPFGFGDAPVAGNDVSEYSVAVDYPVSAALTLSANVAKSTASDQALLNKIDNRTGYALGASYTLSKRTFLYGGYMTNTATNAAGTDTATRLVAAGVQHRF